MAFHTVYGLSIESDVPVPGLPALPALAQGSGQPILRMRLNSWPELSLPTPQQDVYSSPNRYANGLPVVQAWKLADGTLRILYCDGTEFLVEGKGTSVWARWAAAYTLEDAATYLLGPVLGVVLRLRGVVCLHAGAFSHRHGAVALMGPPGAGKSTAVAMFARRGFRALSDDIAALREESASWVVEPGYPRVNLWADSAAALYGSSLQLPNITPNWEKRFVDLSATVDSFEPQAKPLRAVFLLGDDSPERAEPVVERVSGSAALMALVGNTYVNYLLDSPMRAREFHVLGRMVTQVPVFRVRSRREPAALARIPDVILAVLAA